ncbi:tetratricopeptide repeat protein [Aequorivita sp. CIP111184]|uniref:tetratricopeptide repeat protein n=1 Tax=Aequorivita sp. CIP111184 TaxID=2211356 RepID=UPI000DBC3248|nr:tetratricopeptide repeat protein [Aequorivita sp. CIP111184]SRX54877.1 Transcriptional regulatory protein LiaR [Aequorivita sp. CIP111184]
MIEQKKYLYILIFLIIAPITSHSQKFSNNQIDSLFNEIKVKPNTTTKVDGLISLYKKANRSKIKNEAIIDEAIAISEKIFYLKGLGESYDRRGLAARYANDYEQAVNDHKRALSYFVKTTDTLLKIKCLNNLGVSFRKLNLEKEAFDYYFQALALSEKINHDKSISIALNGIGNVFLDIKEYDKALYYFKKVYTLDVKSKNIEGQQYSLSNIGESYLYKKSYDTAYFYINKALESTKEFNNKESEAIRYNLLGLLFQKKEDYKQSTEYYKEAIPMFTQTNNIRYLSNTLINLGRNELHLGHFDIAKDNITNGLKNAKIIKSKENIALGYHALVDYYTITKDYKNALEAHQMAMVFKDSIVNEKIQKSIVSTQIAYETEKKDTEIQQLAIEKSEIQEDAKTNYNRLLISIIGGSSAMIAVLIMFYLYRKNSDLKIEFKNNQLQKFMNQIKELENKANSKDEINQENFIAHLNEFNLTKREIEVCSLIAEGLNNNEIAKAMFVSKNTIKTHIKNIYSKLDVNNRIQAIQKLNVA